QPGARDVRLLFLTRILRMLAYGSSALVLALYLAALQFDERQIGLLLAMTLVGDAVISLWISTVADRIGRKWMLVWGAALMVLGGAVFAATSSFVPLLLGATIGVISPSGNEVGPFLAIEQAALAQNIAGEERASAFAGYHRAGAWATAAGPRSEERRAGLGRAVGGGRGTRVVRGGAQRALPSLR